MSREAADYDEKCADLARHFLGEEARPLRIERLARLFQSVAEEEFCCFCGKYHDDCSCEAPTNA